ncbi:recombinase family protein [bacterium]|nr:recombinase family protein [bacterium]
MARAKRATKTAEGATRVIGYVRVSTDKQADEGVSLAAQRSKLEAYASLYGLELVEVVVDAGVSAKTLDRPGLGRALDRLARGEADGLLVAKLDRLTRSVRDLGTLIAEHFETAALLSVAENIDTRSAAGRLVLNVLASVAQWEREAIGERTSAAMAHMAEEGRFTGGEAPYGYALGQCRHEPAQVVRPVETAAPRPRRDPRRARGPRSACPEPPRGARPTRR